MDMNDSRFYATDSQTKLNDDNNKITHTHTETHKTR